MDEVLILVHTSDGSPCDRPVTPDTDPYCGHGSLTHEQWVQAEPPC